jgi:DnaJ-class molecular chaperone
MNDPQNNGKPHQDTNQDPGDEAPSGTEGTAENLCPDCKGSGRMNDAECQTCGGSGRVTEGVGGA